MTKDEYIATAEQIANELDDLNTRFKVLRIEVLEEHPELFKNSTDFLFAGAETADHFVAYLNGDEDAYLRRKYATR